jgi:hypothetical protein
MLRIRKEQFEAFQPVAEAEFALRLVEHLRDRHPKAIVRTPGRWTLVNRMSDAALLELVKSGIERARSYEFKFASSISAFVVLMFKAAPNFDQHPDISKILRGTKVQLEMRMQSVAKTTSAETWAQVKNSYDAGAWNKKPEVTR